MSFYTILRFCVVSVLFLGWLGFQVFFNKKKDRQALLTDLVFVSFFLVAYGVMYYLLT